MRCSDIREPFHQFSVLFLSVITPRPGTCLFVCSRPSKCRWCVRHRVVLGKGPEGIGTSQSGWHALARTARALSVKDWHPRASWNTTGASSAKGWQGYDWEEMEELRVFHEALGFAADSPDIACFLDLPVASVEWDGMSICLICDSGLIQKQEMRTVL